MCVTTSKNTLLELLFVDVNDTSTSTVPDVTSERNCLWPVYVPDMGCDRCNEMDIEAFLF